MTRLCLRTGSLQSRLNLPEGLKHGGQDFAEPDKYSRTLVLAAEKLIALGIPQEMVFQAAISSH